MRRHIEQVLPHNLMIPETSVCPDLKLGLLQRMVDAFVYPFRERDVQTKRLDESLMVLGTLEQ